MLRLTRAQDFGYLNHLLDYVFNLHSGFPMLESLTCTWNNIHDLTFSEALGTLDLSGCTALSFGDEDRPSQLSISLARCSGLHNFWFCKMQVSDYFLNILAGTSVKLKSVNLSQSWGFSVQALYNLIESQYFLERFYLNFCEFDGLDDFIVAVRENHRLICLSVKKKINNATVGVDQ
jgi:hypothetical protein